ncbi:MAG TPA: MATE family efflux transporter, partial [Anaeromyxobacteraceae bacterium]|nr:MATE family efflux transporter [Anaeromyxobacteraceae bacterium]
MKTPTDTAENPTQGDRGAAAGIEGRSLPLRVPFPPRSVRAPVALSPETRAELRALARLAAPLALASAGQSLMNVVDAAVVGRAGAVPLAGVGLGSLLFFAISVGGMGVVMGLDPLVSQSLGAGDGARARHCLWQGAWLSLLIGAVLAVPLAVVPAVLGPIGIAPDVAAQASGHLLARIPGLPAFLFFYAARSYLQGSHAPRAVLAAAVLGNVVNLLLDLLLVFGGGGLPAWTGPLRSIPALGAVGSGIATTVATWAQALLVAWAAGQVPAGGTWARRPVPAEMRLAVKVGLPIGLHMLAEVGLFALVGLIAGRLGAVAMAAHQVALSLASFSFNAAVGIGNAGSVRVGWAVGAGDTRGARRAGLSAFGLGATLMASWGLAFLLFPGLFARLMSSDPAVVAATTPLLAVAGLFQVSDGIQAVGAGVLRGAGDTRFTLWANVIGHWALGFPAALGLGLALGWGVTGLWWGLLIGLTAVAIALFVRFRRIAAQDIVPLHARAPSAAPSASSPPPA